MKKEVEKEEEEEKEDKVAEKEVVVEGRATQIKGSNTSIRRKRKE